MARLLIIDSGEKQWLNNHKIEFLNYEYTKINEFISIFIV